MSLLIQEICVQFESGEIEQPHAHWRRLFPWGLKKTVKNAPVLDNLSLTVEKNDFLAIVGPSGSGKTTLLRTIAGLTMPSAGRIMLNGTDITIQPPYRREVSIVFQNGGWYDHLTVERHFEFEGESKDACHKLLSQLGLVEVRNRRPAQLSGGQAQRLAIGRALAQNRSVLLLDEPFSQLDQSLRESLRQLLRSIHSQDRTLIYVTHDQNDAMLMANNIAILDRGKIQQVGSPKELFEKPNHRRVAEMVGQPPMQFFNVSLSAFDLSHLADPPSALTSVGSSETIQRAMMDGALSHERNGSVHIGIRPADWQIEDRESLDHDIDRHHRIVFLATLVEERFMGHYRLLYFNFPGTALPTIQIVDPGSAQRPSLTIGKIYSVSVPHMAIHWFNAENGSRIDIHRKTIA